MARNGRIAFEIDSIFSPETEEATKSTSPIGGVASPTVRLTLMIIAKWTGCTPKSVKIGPKIGARMMIAGPASRNIPTTNRRRLIRNKRIKGFSERLRIQAWILSLSENPLILLFLINLLLFVVGMFLDAGPAIIILAPILGPIFTDLGVHPVHFAIIMSVNLTVGLATPPMGLVLFVASSVSGEKIESISKAILPFLAIEVIVIFLITYVEPISLGIPRFFGFISGG